MSGIVESYVLGLADKEERAEFERMCAAHAEVRKARELFEIALEAELMHNPLQASKNIKSKIFAEIDVENDRLNVTDANNIDQPTPHLPPVRETVIPRIGWQRYIAAASIILLIISTALNFYFFSQYKNYSERYTALVAQQTELAKNNDVLRARLDESQNSIAMLRDPDMTVIKMPGTNVATSPDSNSLATVYWNTKSKDVYLLINNLPPAPSDRQYQLWAIVDGQPVNAGVFDVQDVSGLLKMKNMPQAQVFAITLEKRGGSTTPQGPMYVLGKVS